LLDEATRYLDDHEFRRDILLRSLRNHENLYSRTRVSAYGLGDRGWDALPEWTPHTRPVTPQVVKALRSSRMPTLDATATAIWDGTRPRTMPAWVALGRRVFFEYPLRPEVFAEHALAHPEVAREVGLASTPDGTWPGLVVFGDLDHEARVGITCALCHTTLEGDRIVEGRARRDFDYGQLRLAYHRDTGAPLPSLLAARMAKWGPGRADITEDDDEDPVAIPDLWGLRAQSALTQAGTIRHIHPAALAIRQETQILHANRERTRPPRELAWALAMYVYSLRPPPRAEPVLTAAATEGATLFAEHCHSCHDNPAGGGDPIAARRVGTDPTLAHGRARGTGLYRPAPLVRVAEAAPYLHDGTVASLEELLSSSRVDPDYQGGARGSGPIVGHLYGTELPTADRDALLAYLHTY